MGASRIVWGRLDEFQPTDVVNPLDLSKFLLEGRSEARLSVGLVRGRVFLPGSATLDLIAVPGFRAGRFDQLDEPSSPFNFASFRRRLSNAAFRRSGPRACRAAPGSAPRPAAWIGGPRLIADSGRFPRLPASPPWS